MISRHIIQYTLIQPVESVSPPDRPGFRAIFSHWGPVGRYLKPNPIRPVLKLPKTRPITFDYLRTDQIFSRMPLLDGTGENRVQI